MNKVTDKSDSKTSQSFERFERLAKALVAVPKKELDRELAKHERAKKKPKTSHRKI
jgi:hypothetical protein